MWVECSYLYCIGNKTTLVHSEQPSCSSSTMLQTTCIILFSVVAIFLPHGTAMLNLTLPGQHPDPEAVAREVHRYLHHSKQPAFFCLFTLLFLGVWCKTQSHSLTHLTLFFFFFYIILKTLHCKLSSHPSYIKVKT